MAAIDAIDAGKNVPIVVCQVKYFSNIVEQDHRAIKRLTRPMLNFKSSRSACNVLAGIALMHMICKDQFAIEGKRGRRASVRLAASGRPG